MAITFPDSDHEPLELARGESLAIELDIENSPVLFGCRTGICGTCIVRLEGDIAPPDAAEREILEAYVPGEVGVRLACQIRATAPMAIRALRKR